MATYNKFNQYIEDLHHGVHDFSTDQLIVALCSTANAPVATNSVLANLTTISDTNLSGGATSRNITTSTSEGSDGSYELVCADLTLTASGGAMDAFQYVVVYNSQATGVTNPLICWFDYGSSLTLNDGESLTIDFGSGAGNQLLTSS